MRLLDRWTIAARRLRRDVVALYWACRHPRTPWYAKVFAAGLVAYALSPIDLIPDFIPVLGYVDELLLLPLGVILAVKLIPPDVLAECRAQAETTISRPRSWAGAALVVLVWLVLAGAVAVVVFRLTTSRGP